MTSSAALPRLNLHEMLVAGIRDLVAAGELRPGDKVPEQQLCQRFAVSRTPLREALKVLAAEGMLQLLPRRGAIVARVSAEEIDELFPVMASLEALAGDLVCSRISDAELKQLQGMHDRMMQAFQVRDEAAYLKGNRSFHESLVACAHNPTLQTFYAQVLTRTRAFRFVARKSEDNWKAAVEDHRHIMDALNERDGARLSKLLQCHVMGVTVKIAHDTLGYDSA